MPGLFGGFQHHHQGTLANLQQADWLKVTKGTVDCLTGT